VAAIAMSGTPGGDGTGIQLDVFRGGAFDIGQNNNSFAAGILVEENDDMIAPRFIDAVINYNNGQFTFTASETIDATPGYLVNVSNFYISDFAGASIVADNYNLPSYEALSHNSVNLGGAMSATVTEMDGMKIMIQLTEAQRVASLVMSDTTGGNSGVVVLDADLMAIMDIGQNENPKQTGISISEIISLSLYCKVAR
jgi:hypothetical protein